MKLFIHKNLIVKKDNHQYYFYWASNAEPRLQEILIKFTNLSD